MNMQADPNTTKNLQTDPLRNSTEACGFLRISRATLHRYVQRGVLLPMRLPGGQLRFKQSDLLRLLS